MTIAQIKKFPQNLVDCFIPTKTNNYTPYALGRKALSTYSAILIAIKVVVSILFIFYPNLAYLSDVTPDKLISLTNQARQAQGLNTLVVNSKLTSAAQSKAQDMLKNNYFAHISPAGITPWKWIRDSGYSYIYAGENLAMDFVTAQAVHNAWIASSSHQANILSPNFKEIGLAVVCGSLKENETCVVVQTFGSQTLTQATKPTLAISPEIPPKKEVQPKEVSYPSTDTIPPEPPQIVSPQKDSFITNSTPTISGKAEPGSFIDLLINGKAIDKTQTKEDGNFSYTIFSTSSLKDGSYELRARAKDKAGNISQLSELSKFTLDTQPPIIDIANSYVTFNKEKKRLDIFTYVQEDAEKVSALTGSDQIELNNNFGLWAGSINLKDGSPPSVEIKAQDKAGNTILVPIPTQGKIQSAFIGPTKETGQNLNVKANQLSKKLYFAALILLACALALNILVKIKIQHPSTIVSTLLLIGMAIFLILI